VSDEFAGILQYADDAQVERPVMSVPPRVVASAAFIREVRVALAIDDDDQARVVADWIVDKMERFGARSAEPVFDMKGNGPKCSWCGMIWPLCGHHHQSAVDLDDDEGDGS
jgi:hypothetical protein